jgi:flagellin-like protein
LQFRSRYSSRSEGVSPVIGVIITVVIVVVLASITYVWFMSFTSETEKSVVEPLKVSPELNVDRINDELGLKITIGRKINWDDYKVMLNGVEVKTTAGKNSIEGETVYFDYQDGSLIAGNMYTLDIVDIKTQTVVYSETIIAITYSSEGTGIYGQITSSADGSSVTFTTVSLYKNDHLVNSTMSDPAGAYRLEIEEGTYDLVCGINPLFGEISGDQFRNHTDTVTIEKYKMLQYNIIMIVAVPETATLKGQIYNNETKLVIPNIEVRVTNFDFLNKKILSDENGYFEFNLQPIDFTIICDNKGYVVHRADIQIIENETKTYNIYLDPIPPQTGQVNGYVYDAQSGDPIISEKVFTVSPYLTNSTTTNATGYFQINVVPGTVTVFINIVGYKLWEQEITVTDHENYLFPPINLDKEPGG